MIGPKENDEYFDYITYTIGGMMIFPGNKIDGLMTINGARGFNRKIGDRFDLTLECIRRFYLDEESPLYSVLQRYGSFFGLFGDFTGYVDFFFLQDLVIAGGSEIRFFAPFDDFNTSALPDSPESYSLFRSRTIEFVKGRNKRIADLHG
ncbi:MAG: hypothetical protein AB7F88_01450 [Pyrinomonadaceae bacterium]